MVGEALALEIKLVVMAGPEFKRHVEPGVVGRVAHLEMRDGIGQVSSHHLLPDGVTV